VCLCIVFLVLDDTLICDRHFGQSGFLLYWFHSPWTVVAFSIGSTVWCAGTGVLCCVCVCLLFFASVCVEELDYYGLCCVELVCLCFVSFSSFPVRFGVLLRLGCERVGLFGDDCLRGSVSFVLFLQLGLS
jgi:hypothetical protein